MKDQHTDRQQQTATIFDIQHLAVRDGPGIRTSVFFKGCPLRCIWCHNPESHSTKSQLSFQASLCVGCMECVKVCPNGVHQRVVVDGRAVHAVDHQKCIGCGKCLEVCCYDALSLIGKAYTVEEVLQQIRIDLPYYAVPDQNGAHGGVTVSGGEPMAQFAFLKLLLQRLHEMGIHVSMETCGFAETERYLEILPYVDLFLYDYKATDPEKHRHFTGVDNELILKNLKALSDAGAKIVLRLPLVPGVNDDEGHLRGIAQVINAYPGIEHAEVMGYHTLGLSKSDAIGEAPLLSDVDAADEQQKQDWVDRILGFGAKKPVLIG